MLHYRYLLNKVVNSARNAPFPSKGSFDFSELLEALPNDRHVANSYDGTEVFGRFQSSSQLERDKKIGAAGELYVSFSGGKSFMGDTGC
jgi:hypothetical protein